MRLKTMKLTRQARESLGETLRRAEVEANQKRYAEALTLVTEVVDQLSALNRVSASALWFAGVLRDLTGDVLGAAATLKLAGEADCCHPEIIRSQKIVTRRLRETLLDPGLDPGSRAIPSLHEALIESGGGIDPAALLVLGRHYVARSRYEDALGVANALVAVAPTPDALRLRAAAYRGLGRDVEAREAEVEAAAMTPSTSTPMLLAWPIRAQA